MAALWRSFYGIETEVVRLRSCSSQESKTSDRLIAESENKLNSLRLRPTKKGSGLKGSSEAEDLTQVLVGNDFKESLYEVDGRGKRDKKPPSAPSEDDTDLSDPESGKVGKVKFCSE